MVGNSFRAIILSRILLDAPSSPINSTFLSSIASEISALDTIVLITLNYLSDIYIFNPHVQSYYTNDYNKMIISDDKKRFPSFFLTSVP